MWQTSPFFSLLFNSFNKFKLPPIAYALIYNVQGSAIIVQGNVILTVTQFFSRGLKWELRFINVREPPVLVQKNKKKKWEDIDHDSSIPK